MLFHRVLAARAACGLVVVLVASAGPSARADLVYDPERSFRAWGLLVEDALSSPTDGKDEYVEFSHVGPASIDQTMTHTTQPGDTGTATVSILGDADASGVSFRGRATGVTAGNSSQFQYLTATGYTDMQYVFTVDAPTTVTISGLIETSDDDGGGFASFIFEEGDQTIFDHWITADGVRALDLTGANAVSYTLQPGVEYLLFLQTQGFNAAPSGDLGWTDYNVSMTVPEPTGLAGVGLATAALLARRRRGRRRPA
jgi:hypothetical protein